MEPLEPRRLFGEEMALPEKKTSGIGGEFFGGVSDFLSPFRLVSERLT